MSMSMAGGVLDAKIACSLYVDHEQTNLHTHLRARVDEREVDGDDAALLLVMPRLGVLQAHGHLVFYSFEGLYEKLIVSVCAYMCALAGSSVLSPSYTYPTKSKQVPPCLPQGRGPRRRSACRSRSRRAGGAPPRPPVECLVDWVDGVSDDPGGISTYLYIFRQTQGNENGPRAW